MYMQNKSQSGLDVFKKDNIYLIVAFVFVVLEAVNNIVWTRRRTGVYDEKVILFLLNVVLVVVGALLVGFLAKSIFNNKSNSTVGILFLVFAVCMVMHGFMYNYAINPDEDSGDVENVLIDERKNKQHLKISLFVKLFMFGAFAMTAVPRMLTKNSKHGVLNGGLLCGNYLWLFALFVFAINIVCLVKLLKHNIIPTKGMDVLNKSTNIFGAYAIFMSFLKCVA